MRLLTKFSMIFPLPIRRRLFVALGLALRSMTLGVRIIIRDEQERVLLVRHTYIPGWFLPGGGVERGETLHQAAVKELLEECNIEANGPLRLFHAYRNPSTSRFDHVVLFICDQWSQESPKQPDHEIAELGFFPVDALPEGTTIPTRSRLAELQGDQPVSDVW